MKWVPFSIIGLGLAFLVGAGVAFQAESGRGGLVKATGTVVRLEPSVSNSGGGGRSRTWCPVVEFRAANGERYEIEGGVCASPAAYDVGEQVDVDYDPADPADARFGGFFTRHFVTIVFGAMGVIWTGIGFAVFFGMRERWR